MAFIRKVKTKSGATAVQIVSKVDGKIVNIDHLGSAHDEGELLALTQLGQAKLYAGQIALFPELVPALKVQIKEATSRLLWQELRHQYTALGFDSLNDEVFANLCVARLVEPTSKLDSLRVLADLGVTNLDKNQIYRCLQAVIEKDYRSAITRLCFDQVAATTLSLLLYDVTTLYFETQKEDDYRKSGLSKERRLEPQIVVGLLVNHLGFPLGLHSFTGNTAETKTIVPVLEAFRREHRLPKLTVVADAAMMNLKNLEALTQAGYTYIVGSRLTKIPYAIAIYQAKVGPLADNQMVVEGREAFRIIYQYKEKRAALDRRNLEKQLLKATRIVSGAVPAHHSKFVTVKTKVKSLNYRLIEKAQTLVGIKGYVTNVTLPNQAVIDYYHQLFQVEKSFRMAKSDLKARPIFHHKRDAIEAHLTLVLASLAVGRMIEANAGVSLRHFIKTLRPVRSGSVLINGKEHPATEVVPEATKTLLKKLHSGH